MLQTYIPSTESPWTEQRVRYLYRRIGFGANRKTVQRALAKTPSVLVKELVAKAKRQRSLPSPDWEDWAEKKYIKITGGRNEKLRDRHLEEWIRDFISNMQKRGLADKLALFWSNHFVTSIEAYESPQMLVEYHKAIQRNALGNFKELCRKVCLTRAMLIYLNNNENTAEHPNENFARELLELFTLGQNQNYTQKDIQEIARSVSGYETEDWEPKYFNKENWDNKNKTIFGQTGNWDYNDVIDILFQERSKEISLHICRKIYCTFVNYIPNENAIQALAKTLLENDFEIAPVIEQLFTSDHFFQENNIGTKIKSPAELILIFANELDFEIEGEHLRNTYELCHHLGQALFSPPDVAGWQGQRHWVNTDKLTARWEGMDWVFFDFFGEKNMRSLVPWVKTLTGKQDPSPLDICYSVADYFLPKGLASKDEYLLAERHFKHEWPEDSFTSGWWNIDREDTEWQIAQLLQYLFRLPEFQLS